LANFGDDWINVSNFANEVAKKIVEWWKKEKN
jgi:hypothetical protein